MFRNTRQSTRLRRLTLRTLDQPKPTVYLDAAIGRGLGPHKEKFHSYLEVVAREKIPIVHNSWQDVSDALKDLGYIYLGCNTENKRGYISCGSIQVEGTSTWLFKENKGGYIPCGSLLVKDFTRLLEISRIGDCLGTGRRHGLWPNQYKSCDSMEKQTTQGTFVPHGRDNILNTAIGRPDYGGRVRAAGSRVTITQYYGRASRGFNTSSISISQQQLAEIIGILKEEWRKEFQEENKQSLQLLK
ncbi:hypothetical protein GmHk_03G006695 [Glycine max]|nr:hypothetical protein GmHk_03G006695 [Glycine max]